MGLVLQQLLAVILPASLWLPEEGSIQYSPALYLKITGRGEQKGPIAHCGQPFHGYGFALQSRRDLISHVTEAATYRMKTRPFLGMGPVLSHCDS